MSSLKFCNALLATRSAGLICFSKMDVGGEFCEPCMKALGQASLAVIKEAKGMWHDCTEESLEQSLGERVTQRFKDPCTYSL